MDSQPAILLPRTLTLCWNCTITQFLPKWFLLVLITLYDDLSWLHFFIWYRNYKKLYGTHSFNKLLIAVQYMYFHRSTWTLPNFNWNKEILRRGETDRPPFSCVSFTKFIYLLFELHNVYSKAQMQTSAIPSSQDKYSHALGNHSVR